MNRLHRLLLAATGLLSILLSSPANAVSFFNTPDPNANTTAPTGALTGSGWQYEGQFGAFLGTAISPHHFITVKHIGIASNIFVYQGANYTVLGYYDDPASELRIFQVAETMPSYAPLYSRSDELNRNLVVIGRGTQRGDPIYEEGRLSGWSWGQTDMVQRWGENQVSEAYGYVLFAAFDQNGRPNEAHLSSGDSGGAVFINDGGTWKLAGINFSVDGPFSTTANGSGFNAMLFDARGFYNCFGQLISGPAPVASGFYALRISAQLPWIQSVIGTGQPPPTPTPTPTPTPPPTPTPTPPPVPSPTPTPVPTPTPTPVPSPTPAPSPSPGPGRIITPAPRSMLPSSFVTFTWSGGSATSYALLVGTSRGRSDIYNSGKLSVCSIGINNLPIDGSTVYVRLRSRMKKKWQYFDYTYTAYTYHPNGASAATAASSSTAALEPAPQSESDDTD
jgi:hypothetical protein